MGVLSSQDIFDQLISKVLSHCRRTIHQRDDILGGGRTMEEMFEEYKTVLQAFLDHGLTLDPAKTQVGLTSIKFHGHIFDQDGLRPDPDKVAALKNAPPPPHQKALLSFICSVQWNQSFIPRFSELVLPLRQLALTEGPMKWTTKHQECFQALKDSLCANALNNHFDPQKKTALFCDAGKNGHIVGTRGGFSGYLTQLHEGVYRPVHLGSRGMTAQEAKWGQSEIEARAIRWATDKFRPYLVGASKFDIFTDCKSLLPLFNKVNKGSDMCPPRIARQILAMQDLDYELKFKAGKDNMADFASRCPQEAPEEEVLLSDELELQVVRSIVGDPVCLEKLKEATAEDEELLFVKDRIANNDWNDHKKDPRIRPYLGTGVEGQLSHIDGLIFRGHTIVVPTALRHHITKLIHERGHQGEANSRGLLRETFWFPGFANYVTSVITSCPDCQHVTRSYRREPMGISPTPSRPFQMIAMDYKGPFHDGFYALVIICLFSRYPDAVFVTSTSFEAIEKHLLRYFAQHGVPIDVKSDNGSPFNSAAFAAFAKHQGFKHSPVLARHPEANGEVERYMADIKKAYGIARLSNANYKTQIIEMLKAKRATPHPTVGKSPHEVAFGWKMRTGILSEQPRHLPEDQKNQQVVDGINEQKLKNKARHDAKRNVHPHTFRVNDRVLVDLQGNGKYEKELYVITRVHGVSITATRPSDGKTVKRHANHFKVYVDLNIVPEGGIATGVPIQQDDQDADAEDGAEIGEDGGLAIPFAPLQQNVAQLPGGAAPINNAGHGQGQPQGQRGGHRAPPRNVHFNENMQVREFLPRRQTRSGGPAPDLPNVQPAVLERSVQLRGQLQRQMDAHNEQQRLDRQADIQLQPDDNEEQEDELEDPQF
jgi:transposase InsO family protein